MTLQAARHWLLITLGILMFTGIPLSATPQGVGTTGPQIRGLKGDPLRETREVHLRNIRQLTTGGTNAEAYFSYDGKYLIFQATRDGFQCDQIFLMNSEGSEVRLLSTGKGRTTCGYFLPGNQQVIYASTHLGEDACPPQPNRSQGYVWPIYPSYQIFRASLSGIITEQLTRAPGYNAEATVSPDGRKMVFTSTRDGDLELYDMDLLTRRIRRLTHQEGYDGGAFYSPDGQWMAFAGDDTGMYEIYVRPFPDVESARWQVSTGGGTEPVWSPDGRELFYRMASAVMSVPVNDGLPSTWGTPEVVYRGTYRLDTVGTYSHYYDVSPNGDRFLMIQEAFSEGDETVLDMIFVEHWFEELTQVVPRIDP